MPRPRSSAASILLLLLLPAAGCGDQPRPARANADGGTVDIEARGLVVLDDGVTPPAGVPDRPDFHSFGEVPDGSTVRHTFRLRNVEPGPIAVTGIHPGCGCTAAGVLVRTADGEVIEGHEPEAAGEVWVVVPPEAIMELTLAIDTRDIASKNKDRTLTTRVVTDSEVGRYRTFEVHLFVAQDLQVNPRTLRLVEVPVGIGGSAVVDVVPVGERDVTLGEVLSAPAGVRVEVVSTDLLGQSIWQVQASLDPPLELGSVVGQVEVATLAADGNPGPPLSIPLLARVVPDLELEPQRLVLVDRGDEELAAEVRLSSRRPGERLTVRSAELEGEGAGRFRLELAADDLDARGRSLAWTLRLTPRVDADGAWPDAVHRGEVVVQLERASEDALRVPWVYHPRP